MVKLTTSIVSSRSRNENTTFVIWSQTSSSKFQVTLAFTDIKCPKPESKDEKILKYYIIYIFVRMKCIWVGFSIILGKKKHVTLLFEILRYIFHTQRKISDTQHVWKKMWIKFFLLSDFYLVWKWTYVILTHTVKWRPFCLPLTVKEKKDFVKISFSRPLFLPFQFPYHNLWTHGETQKFSSVPIT